ncbi:hypothetical protein PSV08DRAFT_350208 [Bipolaris maydis]|uniref:uncharacterized protein n=1 Tax=Cochliobolus heterostrophus TaxID=5016 RepID=UPI0024D71967|nr:hypothetical protein J3E73DRAFT_219410 [Bipolaris maydis]KAJ6272090.1 hypothetical protein PSV08DRAFT_350208 [Bipolaris maydis]KAJ6281821.1 hypothetical protein J3E71DRAFT_198051 [Bipolaris maydis]
MDLIEREYPTSDDKPPWYGMVFKQSVYSDAMLESLKRRYPQGANLRERKHMAAIEFLQQELEDMQASEAALIPKTNPTNLMSDVASHDRQHQKIGSLPYSPTAQLSTPNITNGYHGRRSPTNKVPLVQSPTVSSNMSGQEIVFSIANRPVVQRQRRKKMTASEKISYKQMRKIGACDSCKRQKAKCRHVGGERDKYRNSRGASSTPQRDTRPVSDSAALTVNATNEHRRQTQAPQNSRELSYELKSSLQTVSVATPVTVSGSPSPHWVQDTQESAQSELSGYVPASITSKHYSVYSDATIESTIDPQLLDMNYRDPVVFTEANGAFPMSLTPRTTPSRSFYSKNTSSEFCSPVQGYHQDMTNPSQPNPRFYISP